MQPAPVNRARTHPGGELWKGSEVLVVFVWLCALAISACSGSEAASCDHHKDCFTDEICDDGYCRIMEQNQSSEIDRYAQCVPEAGCERLVDAAVVGPGGLIIAPEDDNIFSFGCPSESDEVDFMGGSPDRIEAHICSDDRHFYRLRTETCDTRNFIVEIELVPSEAACPVDELGDVVLSIGLASAPECDSETTTECWVAEDAPEGGHRWTVYFDAPWFEPDYVPLDLTIWPDDERSFPYELSFHVEER